MKSKSAIKLQISPTPKHENRNKPKNPEIVMFTRILHKIFLANLNNFLQK